MSYPDGIPYSEIKAVLDIVRSGNLKASAASLAYNAWVVQGYAQKMVFGDPTMLLSAQSAADPLEVLNKIAESEGQLEAQLSIPWDVILKYAAQLAITALQAAIAG